MKSSPPPLQPLLIVLDLDETLIHGTQTPLERPPDFHCEKYGIYRRPGLAPFLAGLQEQFAVAVWTSAGPAYARCVVENIFPEDFELQFLWSRGRCTHRVDGETGEQQLLKNLKKVRRWGYSLERVVVIDDTPSVYSRSYGNLIQVRGYDGEPEDDELELLGQYLRLLRDEPNVRHIEKRAWRNAAQY